MRRAQNQISSDKMRNFLYVNEKKDLIRCHCAVEVKKMEALSSFVFVRVAIETFFFFWENVYRSLFRFACPNMFVNFQYDGSVGVVFFRLPTEIEVKMKY